MLLRQVLIENTFNRGLHPSNRGGNSSGSSEVLSGQRRSMFLSLRRLS